MDSSDLMEVVATCSDCCFRPEVESDDEMQSLSWLFTQGLDPRCDKTTCTAANCCGVHIHEGTTCSDADAIGGHFWNKDLYPEDPWMDIRYVIEGSMPSKVNDLSVTTGFPAEKINGRAVVVHDYDGVRIGCATIKICVDSGSTVQGAIEKLEDAVDQIKDALSDLSAMVNSSHGKGGHSGYHSYGAYGADQGDDGEVQVQPHLRRHLWHSAPTAGPLPVSVQAEAERHPRHRPGLLHPRSVPKSPRDERGSRPVAEANGARRARAGGRGGRALPRDPQVLPALLQARLLAPSWRRIRRDQEVPGGMRGEFFSLPGAFAEVRGGRLLCCMRGQVALCRGLLSLPARRALSTFSINFGEEAAAEALAPDLCRNSMDNTSV